MRILITADLHYDVARSRYWTEDLARRACAAGGDALVLVGDTAGAVHETLRDCLGLFAGFTGRKFLVPGNHCLWCLDGEDSLERYNRTIPAIAAEAGFAVLDQSPAVLGDVGLVGSIGWYDYSYRHASLDFPIEFYQAKVTPAAAERLAEHKPLWDAFGGQVQERHFNVAARWMDGVRVRMAMTDAEFLDYVVARLGEQLRALSADAAVRQVIAFVHHLPFRELVPPDRPPRFAFAAAYMGSDKIGRAIAECPKVTHVYCGHSHWPGKAQVGRINVINVGSTYVDKKLELLEV
jgi:hypothetical protein